MTQTDAIEKALLDARGKWVAMPELHVLSGSLNIHSRVADLRRRGHKVENIMGDDADGVKKSWYRIVMPEPERVQEELHELFSR